MTVLDIQNEFIKDGIQWQEHIFNDGGPNCYVEFTRDRNPHVFSEHPRPKDSVGWGRFDRESAWKQAYEWLQRERKKGDEK